MECISCGNSSFSIFSENSYLNLPVTKCESCKLMMTGKTLEQLDQTLKNYYEKSSTTNEIKKTIEVDHLDNHGRYLRNLWGSHYNYIKPLLKKSKELLEIGPGTGLALRLFEKEGFMVSGIETNENYVKIINDKLENGECFHGFVEELDIKKKFDVIWLSHVFEHIVKPDLLLDKCQKLLKEDGFIFIAIPDCENPDILKQSIHENASSFHYTKNSLEKLVLKTGLIIEKCESFREFVRIEGRFQMVLEKYFHTLSQINCPYFPFKRTNGSNGVEIRLILKKK